MPLKTKKQTEIYLKKKIKNSPNKRQREIFSVSLSWLYKSKSMKGFIDGLKNFLHVTALEKKLAQQIINYVRH